MRDLIINTLAVLAFFALCLGFMVALPDALPQYGQGVAVLP